LGWREEGGGRGKREEEMKEGGETSEKREEKREAFTRLPASLGSC
jgi:hypothetical protein